MQQSDIDKRMKQLVSELRELRLARDQADARMLLRLVKAEDEELDIVLNSGCDSFDQFVQEFVKPARYQAFKRGVQKVGAAEALRIGSAATTVAGRLTNGPDEYVRACAAWTETHSGTLPTQQTAERILKDVDPRKSTPRPVKQLDELARLRAENKELRAENRSLKSQLAKLKKKAA